MFSRWLVFESFFLNLILIFFIRRVIRKSNNKSYRARSVSEVNQKVLFREKYVFYRPWSVRIEKNFAPRTSATFETLGKVFLDTDLPVGK